MDEPLQNVTTLVRDDRTFYLVGTAHVSEKSVQQVRDVIAAVRPDTVCIELCQTRYQTLMDANRWRNLDIFKVIKEGKTLLLMANLAISSYQRRLGQQLGVKPGAELVAAATAAKEVGAEICLVDREIQVTLKRTWANLSFWKKLSLVSLVLQGSVNGEKISAEDIERLKEKTQLSEILQEFAKVLPEVKEPLIDERDRYLISGVEAVPGKTVVAVVGAGHVEGMIQHFGKPVDRKALERVPPKSAWMQALKWLVPLLVLLAFGWGYHKNQGQSLAHMVWAWVLPTSVFAAALTAVAGGKLLSILSAILASPITTLNPLIGAGMVVGLVEAYLRRPTVEDAENLQDVHTIREVYRNRFTRVLLVAIMSTIGAALGAWVGLGWVIKLAT